MRIFANFVLQVNTYESYRDYEPEDTKCEAASCDYSWYDIGTPLPSSPQSPLPQSDNNESPEDEDGYTNLTAEYYPEYDRWYAEDSQNELDEMLVETLIEKEMDSVKLMAIRHKIRLLTLQCLGTRIAILSGIKPENYDCCINICHAFTEQFAEETVCSKCDRPRYDSRGRPRQTYQYIPRIPLLQALFNNPEMVEKLLYRHNYAEVDGAMDNLFDSELYRRLC
ncbi:hypothetical protein FRC08_016040 [Ceratobasidium sp. 394]|nr:hypothetical protein FRC08_016040 [Ceratobasidium sp. 394]